MAAAEKAPAENIHIPKMFAAPKDKNGKTELPGLPKEEEAAAVVTGNYGREVVKLHNEGVSEVDIAKRLGIGVGEVRLAISLNGGGSGSEA